MEVTYRRNTISQTFVHDTFDTFVHDEDQSLKIYSKWEHLHK